MFAAVVIIHIIVSIALILIVLLQAGKGSGIANVFGGAGQTVFGARTDSVLTKGTSVCAAVFMITSLGLAMLSAQRAGSVMSRRSRQSSTAMPLSPSQQSAVAKMQQAVAGIAETVKKAASEATKENTAVPAPQAAIPAAPAPVAPANVPGPEKKTP